MAYQNLFKKNIQQSGETIFWERMFEAFQEQTDQHINSMKGGGNGILVTVRVRPLTNKEKVTSSFQTISVLDGQLLVLQEQEEGNAGDTLRRNRSKELQYAFDFVFDQQVKTKQIYEATVEGLLDGVMEGYHATVLAYGATSCGKTYTMVGENDKEPGIMALTVLQLLNRISQAKKYQNIKLKASYIEIYNENIKDLLISDDKNFELREDPKEGVMVPGVNQVTIDNLTQLKTVLKVGSKNRTKESTANNEASSRSHAILQLQVQVSDKASSVSQEVFISKFSLVDLAGSERGGTMVSNNQRMAEGTKINQSLLVLGNCIQALSQAAQKGVKNAFVPYRGSKLTRLLKDALGGNCRTVMIAHLSPSLSVFEETYNTLVYVNRAKNIKNNAIRNCLIAENHVSNYVNVIKNLKKENDELKAQLRLQVENKNSPQKLPPVQIQAHAQEIERMEMKIRDHFGEETKLMKSIAGLDGKIQALAFQIFSDELLNKQTKGKTEEAAQLSSQKLKICEQLQLLEAMREVLLTEVKMNQSLGKTGQESVQNFWRDKKNQRQILYIQIREENIRKEKKMMNNLIQNLKKKVGGQKAKGFGNPNKLLTKKNNIISRITYSQLDLSKSDDISKINKKPVRASPLIEKKDKKKIPNKKLLAMQSNPNINGVSIDQSKGHSLQKRSFPKGRRELSAVVLGVQHKNKKNSIKNVKISQDLQLLEENNSFERKEKRKSPKFYRGEKKKPFEFVFLQH